MRGIVLAAALLTACTSQAPFATPASTTQAPTTTAPTTTSTQPVAEQMPKWVEQAAIPRDGMADYGFAAPTEQEYRSDWMLMPCMVVPPALESYTNSLHRKWAGDRVDLRHTVVAFEKFTGVQFIEQLKAETASCTDWEYDNGQRYDMRLDVPVREPEGLQGVEAFYGFCVDTVEETGPARRCVAFLARGNVVSSLYVIQRTEPLTASLDKLYELLPRAVQHLTT
ncbi:MULTISPECIES: hypothetical protein [unclassified Saccharothrix]|uniref:hypothetical protein n=1 Tax=unclassified Saccharothrix TaxID=2593673 RepID=UPI00307CF75C